MYSGKPLKVHIELSNKCNAMCPQCGRNTSANGELRLQAGMQTTELRLGDIEESLMMSSGILIHLQM